MDWLRRGRLVAYGAALERRFTRKGIEGSNPSPSAKNNVLFRPVPLKLYIRRAGFLI